MNMREKPIIFNTHMVQAILAGKKTQARRPVRPEIINPNGGLIMNDNLWKKVMKEVPESFGINYFCPFGEKCDRLWVRETFADVRGMGFDHPNGNSSMKMEFSYKADCNGDSLRIAKEYGVKWKPSIHMPRIASRIDLEVTGVRIERLHDITDDDAKKEGFDGYIQCESPFGWFKKAWKLIYKSWDENPWVWVVDFKRIK